jgi:hypothetical protein
MSKVAEKLRSTQDFTTHAYSVVLLAEAMHPVRLKRFSTMNFFLFECNTSANGTKASCFRIAMQAQIEVLVCSRQSGVKMSKVYPYKRLSL